MDEKDVLKLFDFLDAIHSNKKADRSEISVLQWALILRPWEYNQVRGAAIRRARVNRFYPDPSELAVLLPQPTDTSPRRAAGVDPGYAWQAEIDAGRCVDAADELGGISRYAREHGISWQEAKVALSAEGRAK